ncbi:DUF4124 domain-containing protein [Shewanella nanhaiensis]|uniref:DUF4124 domain-containing protein n=1 Tax=Shewanella nanhaiensis TaxID=2864872 RepID=A0ABS7E3I8_9GAMM|nr:DUF4124 domain-containing protein [Shewanella nanhaiensis]MBW8184239.1 DUF4124 domain-containing protein [Shewanella nanhaiensis]
MLMFTKLILLSLSLTLTFTVSATVIHKWVDKDGVTHYSQQPPENTDTDSSKLYSEDIEQKPIGFIQPKVRESSAAVQTEDEKNAEAIRKQSSEQAAAICENAKQNLNILTSHSRLKSKDEKTGEMVSMREEDRQEQISTQKERIKLFCKK